MGFNENKFISPLFKLFGKRLAKVPPSPQNNDVIQFNSTSNEWELISGIIGNAVQSSSNVGAGAGLALPRVLDDLPFKSLVDGVEIVITVSATELTFSIGAIAISKITGLQVILDSKIESLTNVGGFNEIAKAKVGTNVDLRTLQAGTNITIVQNANDLEISSTDTGQSNTASNVGIGQGVFKQKVGVNLEFKSLLANLEILITNNANDLAFTIGEIAQSKITDLVNDLANRFKTFQNIGGGAEIGKLDTGTEFDLRTLLGNLEIIIVQNAQDISFSIGVIAQSKITGLVTALASKIETITNIGTGGAIAKAKVGTNVDLRSLLGNLEIIITENVSDLAFTIGVIAQSKITGLVADLASKIETITNVGGFAEIAKAKVGTNVDVRTLKAGTDISIVQNANDIEISATGGGAGKLEELARTEILVNSATLTVNFSGNTRKNLFFYVYVIPAVGSVRSKMQFNNDVGNNYAERFIENYGGGSGGSSSTNNPDIDLSHGNEAEPVAMDGWIRNFLAQNKLGFVRAVGQENVGAGTAPEDRMTSFKWADLVAQIDEINVINDGGGGLFGVGSFIIVCGFD